MSMSIARLGFPRAQVLYVMSGVMIAQQNTGKVALIYTSSRPADASRLRPLPLMRG